MIVKKFQEGVQDQIREGDHGHDHAETVISIPGDHVRDHVLDHGISRRVVKEHVRDQDQDIGVLDRGIRIEDGRVQDADQVPAVENRIIDVDQGPLVVGGVRGHTDIESYWIFRLYFITEIYWKLILLCTSQ